MEISLRAKLTKGEIFQLTLTIIQALAVWWIWPRLKLPMLGREESWFALSWFLLLIEPVFIRYWLTSTSQIIFNTTMLSSRICYQSSFFLSLIFLVTLFISSQINNYKLLLGIIYLTALTLQLAGLTFSLHEYFSNWAISNIPKFFLFTFTTTISTLACLVIIPLVRPELCALWPPPPKILAAPLIASIFWGIIAGTIPLIAHIWGANQRTTWLSYLAVSLGPGPALAIAIFTPKDFCLVILILAILTFLRLIIRKTTLLSSCYQSTTPIIPLYWIFPALLFLWWGIGIALTLATTWWQPQAQNLIIEALWLRAIGLGFFITICIVILIEYSLPLIIRPHLIRNNSQCKILGIIISMLVLLASLSPFIFFLINPISLMPTPPPMLNEKSRSELLSAPLTLCSTTPEISLSIPSWLTKVSHIFVVSLLTNSSEIPQGEAVVQLIATDDLDIPHIYHLRAGLDTAETALNKRDITTVTLHSLAHPAQKWTVYSPTGEEFEAYNYYTGLFLGSKVNHLKNITLRYFYHNSAKQSSMTLALQRIFLN